TGRMRIIALVGLSCALLAGSAAIGQASAAAAHPARPGPPGHARPVPGPVPGTGTPADSPGQACFFTFPNCTSGDPAVAFTMNSAGDSTGCTFQQDTEWGDGSHTTLSYNGGKNGMALITFQHAYSAPGVYQISSTIVVQVQTGSCSGGTFSLQFTLPAPPDVSCQSAQFSTTPLQVPVNLPSNPLQLSYGPASLSFGAGKTSGGSLCTMPPAASVLPVDIDVPHATPVKIAEIDSTDSIEFHAANNAAIGVPNCNFSALQALASTAVTPPLSDFAGTNNCLLTPTFHASWDVVAKLSSPGFTVTARSAATGKQLTLFSTGPVTYYVDLDTMPNSPGSSATFTQTMQALESFVRTTLLQDIPVIDKIALFQVTPGRSQVTDPLGRLVGVGTDTKVTRSFPGAGYAKVGGRSIAWVLEPVPGTYHVTIRGTARSKFQADFTILELLGHGDNPIIKNIGQKASLGAGGTATSKVPEVGQADVPVPQPHESHTRIAKGQKVTFNLHHSVIGFIPAKVTWSFGDGSKASVSPATHTFKRAGHFVPEVTVTNALDYSVTVSLHVIDVTG
ncbi:MAG TPA: PKD domain-containing protein, partial [Streptosporangiaceae bacterium]|nr:PKD domain-containing protein [Streptosporangiaceae bacterium]